MTDKNLVLVYNPLYYVFSVTLPSGGNIEIYLFLVVHVFYVYPIVYSVFLFF